MAEKTRGVPVPMDDAPAAAPPVTDQPACPPVKKPAGPKRLRIHLLVKREGGPIKSDRVDGPIPIGTKSEWAAACDGAVTFASTLDRGTTEPWGVRCDACKLTEAFKAIDRPKPTLSGGQEMVATGEACC